MHRLFLGLTFALVLSPFTVFADEIGFIPPPPPPLTSNQSASTTVGTPITIRFTVNDAARAITPDVITFATTSSPAGTLGTIDADGSVLYTPPATAGQDSFQIKVDEYNTSDLSTPIQTSTATITIDVAASSSTPDTTAPVISVPSTQIFATSTFPAFPTLITASAIDDVDGAVAVHYSPTSFSEGSTTVTWTASDTAGNTVSATSTVVVNAEATFAVRDGSTLIGPFTITLPATDTAPVVITSTDNSASSTVPARSVLALLSNLDQSNSDFQITDLQYFSSFGSFLLNCISIPAASSSPACLSWTYAVNGSFPSVGMDHTTLSAGDTAYVFFGSPRQVTLSTSTITAGGNVTATAQAYDSVNGVYAATTGVTVGVISIPDASTPWVYTEIATSSVDSNGQAIFTLNATGTYAVGIQEDFYSPTSALTVTDATSNSSNSGSSSGGGGGGGGISHGLFSVPKALAYLASVQHADGSFDNDVLTDWAALTFAAQDGSGSKAKLTTYAKTATPSVSSVTDYERHAMALEALGINPYNGTGVDYITPIVTGLGALSCDIGTINAQTFAIFPLLHAGYSASDSVIQNAVACIISAQQPNGSWNDPDSTSAAIQALSLTNSLPNVTNAMAKAQTYLKSQEQSNGGFSNSPSTSWALQAIAALGQSESQWAPAGYYPSDYLATLQQTDGGVEPNSKDSFTRAWATEYAVPGVLGKTWGSLLSSFSRPVTGGGSGGSATATTDSSTTTATTTTATSTSTVATTTSALATTTSTIMPTVTTLGTIPTAPTPTLKTVAVRTTIPKTVIATTTVVGSASTTPSAQVAAAASVAGGFDWMKLFYLILGFLALCGLSWLAYTLVVKRS